MYGEIYAKEIEYIIDKISLFDWFERLLRVAESLNKRDYVVLSDVESYNTWIEFNKKKDHLYISIINADKPDGTTDIEYKLYNRENSIWSDQKINYLQFNNEIISVLKNYIEDLIAHNLQNDLFEDFNNRVKYLQKIIIIHH